MRFDAVPRSNPLDSREATISVDSLLSSSVESSSRKPIVKQISRRDVTAQLISRWRDLQTRSCHSNAFLSPDFLLPAWNYLDPNGDSFLLTVEEQSSDRLLALGCFVQSPASRTLPFRHIVAAKTIHSYRTGLLLDDKQSDAALDAWLMFIHSESNWHGIQFPSLRLDSILAQRLQSAVERLGLGWHTDSECQSAALFPPIASCENIYGHLSAKRSKSLRRKRHGLQSHGVVRMRRLERHEDHALAVEQFLDLEDAGWKGEQGTSMRSSCRGIEFLKALTKGFHDRGQLVITQLLVGDDVAATAISLAEGTTLFTFKIGWSPRYSKGSPGQLHMQMLLPVVCNEFPNITCLDSCARPGSFIEDLWPHQISVGNVVLPTSRVAQGAVATLSAARRALDQLRRNFAGRPQTGSEE